MSSVARSPQIAGRLTGLTSVDLVWRVPALTPGDGAGVDIALALLGLSLEIGDVGVLAEVTTWVLLGYIAAVLTPRAYPGELGVPAGESSYQVLFGVVTVALAVTIRQGTDEGTPVAMLAIFLLTAVCAVFLLSYLKWWLGWTLSPADQRFVRLIDAFFPTSSVEAELRRDFDRRGLLGFVGRVIARAAAGVVVVFPAFLSGIVVVVLLQLYPLPDLLVLGWAGLWVIQYATGRDVTPRLASLDVETHLYDIVEESTKSVKGTTLAIYLLSLTFGFGLLFALAFSVGVAVVTDGARGSLLWNLAGFLFVVVASSCYGLWCCVRLGRRLPAFLRQHVGEDDSTSDDASPNRKMTGGGSERRDSSMDDSNNPRWDDREVERQEVTSVTWSTETSPSWWQIDYWEHLVPQRINGEGTGQSVPRRPVGTVIPPLMAVVLVALTFAAYGLDSNAFAMTWPLALLGLVACLLLTRHIGREAVSRDDHAIIVGMVVFVCTTHILGSLEATATALQSGDVSPNTLPFSVYVAGMLVWLGYLDEAFRYSDRHDDIRRLTKSVYLLAFTLVFAVLLPVTGGPYRSLFVMLLIASGIGGGALFVTGWLRL